MLKRGKVLSKNLGQKLHELLLCIIATLTVCVDSHGHHAYYGYFIPTFFIVEITYFLTSNFNLGLGN